MSNLFHNKTECWKCGSSGSCSCSTTVSRRSETDEHWLNGENSTYFVYFIACFYRNRRVFVYTNVPWVLLLLLYQLESLSCCSGNASCRLEPMRSVWSHCVLGRRNRQHCGISAQDPANSNITWIYGYIGNITWVSLYGAFGDPQG